MKLPDGTHLTYCSNIHPGETWPDVRANLERFVPEIRDQVAPGQPFGIGLRLSARAAEALAAPAALSEFQTFLRENGFYVFTLNGFPYGPFHGTAVKADVYRPDWREAERLPYTNRLADLLAALLPADGSIEGSVSTVPGAFKPLVRSDADVQLMTEALLRHVAHTIALKQRTGRTVTLALEPEPCCYLETIAEVVSFFGRWVFTAASATRLAQLAAIPRHEAEEALRTHLGICLDLCHAAVEFEDARACTEALSDAGIRLLKIQISSGLRIPNLDAPAIAGLRRFEDAVYLHQVVESGPAGLRRYTDLPEALATLEDGGTDREWRVHFHVPVFLETLETFSSTQSFIREVLASHRNRALSAHLEVETYTWDVLPAQYRAQPVGQAIARELLWVRRELGT